MKFIALSLMSLLGFSSLTGCSMTPETPSTDLTPVEVSQASDLKLSCQQLEPKLNSIEERAKILLAQKQQNEQTTFALSSLADMALVILSGSASANNRIDRSALVEFSASEKALVQSLSARHHHLMNLGRNQQCEFVPKIEQRIEQYRSQRPSATPALDAQNYRKRLTP